VVGLCWGVGGGAAWVCFAYVSECLYYCVPTLRWLLDIARAAYHEDDNGHAHECCRDSVADGKAYILTQLCD
jgi:hypothetical protein